MNKIITSIFVLFLTIPTISFSAKIKDETKKIEIYGIQYSPVNFFEGSPFLDKDWSISKLDLNNGNVIEDIRIKYNILSSDIVFYHDKFRKLFSVDQATLKSFTLNYKQSNYMYFEKYIGDNVGYKLNNNDFVHIVYKGNIKFFIKHTAYISETNDINSKDKILPTDLFFIQKGNETHEIKLKIKSIIRIFPKEKQYIKKIVSDYKLKNRSINDIAKLIELLDRQI